MRVPCLPRSQECPPRSKTGNPSHRGAAFSLIEIALALGIVAFGLLSVLALFPVGLKAQANAVERQRATSILQSLETAVRAEIQAEGKPVYRFGDVFKLPDPISWKIGSSAKTLQYFVHEDGALERVSGSPPATARQCLRLWIRPAAGFIAGEGMPTEPLRVWASIAWPASAKWTGGRWVDADGSMQTLILSQPDAN